MTRKRLPALAIAALLVAVAFPAGRAGAAESMMLALPGSFLTPTYGQPATVVQTGGELTFTNLDAQPHDVVAVQKQGQYAPVQCASATSCPDGTPSWCLPGSGGALPFPAGSCPIVWSALVGLGRSTPVMGIQFLTAGQTIEFYCTRHPAMKGYLVAV